VLGEKRGKQTVNTIVVDSTGPQARRALSDCRRSGSVLLPSVAESPATVPRASQLEVHPGAGISELILNLHTRTLFDVLRRMFTRNLTSNCIN